MHAFPLDYKRSKQHGYCKTVKSWPQEPSLMAGEMPLPRGELALLCGEFALLPGKMTILCGELALLSGEFALLPGEMEMLSGDLALLPGEIAVIINDFIIARHCEELRVALRRSKLRIP